MIEQPPKPDTPGAPDVVKVPGEVNGPIPSGKPDADNGPGIQPAPPPTDPAPPII